jgi:putative hydrolase of the HAD superfamily
MGKTAAVIFDLDDTLYPERQYVLSGYTAVGEYLRQSLDRRDDFEGWLWERFCQRETGDAFDEMNRALGLGLERDQILQLVGVYREHRPVISPFEDVEELLGALAGRWRLGLLSDGFLPAQRLKLDALRIERFFEAIVFTEEIGRDAWKPSPAGFERMAELLATPHEACTYVADNPAKDFVAPNALGWRSIQFIRPGQVHSGNAAAEGGRARVTVSSPDQLRQALL